MPALRQPGLDFFPARVNCLCPNFKWPKVLFILSFIRLIINSSFFHSFLFIYYIVDHFYLFIHVLIY